MYDWSENLRTPPSHRSVDFEHTAFQTGRKEFKIINNDKFKNAMLGPLFYIGVRLGIQVISLK